MLKQFKKDFEGCGEYYEGGFMPAFKCNKNKMCEECQSKIKAKIESMKEMKEFLEKNIEFLVLIMSRTSYSEGYFSFVEEIHKPEIEQMKETKEMLIEKIKSNNEKLEKINTCLKLAEERGLK